MSRKPEKILSELVGARHLVNTDIGDVPYRLAGGIGIQIAEARARIGPLSEELKAIVIPSRLVGCFASGDGAKIAEIGAVISENRGIVVDASAVYQFIVDAVDQSMGQDRVFTTLQHNLLVEGMVEAARGFDLTFVDPPVYSEVITPTRDDLFNHIRTKVCSTAPVLVKEAVTRSIMASVEEGGLVDKKLPVLVLNTGVEDRESLSSLFLASGSFEFNQDFEVSKESIVTTFRSFPQPS
jgi:hypothetical protein